MKSVEVTLFALIVVYCKGLFPSVPEVICLLEISDQPSLTQFLLTVNAAIYDEVLCIHSGHTGDLLDIFYRKTPPLNSGNKVENV